MDLLFESENASIKPFNQQQHVFYFTFFGLVCTALDTGAVEPEPGAGAQATLDGRSQKYMNGGAGNVSSSSTDINSMWSKPVVQIIQRF